MINAFFWADPYIENLDPVEKLLFLYLLTNEHCNIAGMYEVQPRRMSYETGIETQMIEKILARFEKDKKILRVDSWILLVNFAKHQSMLNPNVVKGIQRIINALPSRVKALKGFERLSHFTILNLTYRNAEIKISDSSKKTMRTYTDEDQYQEKAVDADTGEVIHPSKEKNTKKPRNKSALKLVAHFSLQCKKHLRTVPLQNKVSYLSALRAVDNMENDDDISELIDQWFASGKEKEDLIQISQCFSANNINRFKAQHA